MISPLTVVPLQRRDEPLGLSQFDQSLSSYASVLSGVHEKRFVDCGASFLDRWERWEASLSIGIPSCRDSPLGATAFGAPPSKTAEARGRELFEDDARIVCWSPVE